MFNSNILSEQNIQLNERAGNALRNDAWPSFLYGMLEFNDRMHEIETNAAITDYRMLKEDAINEANNTMLSIKETEALQESVAENIKKRIMAAIQAIIDFIKNFISMLTQKDLKVRRRFKEMKRKTGKFVNMEKNNNSYTFTVFHGPTVLDFDENKCRSALNNITAAIDRICRGEYDADVSDASLATAYRALGRVIRPKDSSVRHEFSGKYEDAKSFAEYVRTDIIYKERINMSYREWQASIAETIPCDKGIIAQKLSLIKGDLEKSQKDIARAAIVDEHTKKNADAYIAQIRAIVSSVSWYLNALYDQETRKLAYIMSTYTRIKGGNFSDDHMNEFGMIHGESFDSDTLFGNEDLDDFNRTEWLNLGLTTECFSLKYELDESKRRIALAEANIMVDDDYNKISRLNIMREAEEKKAGNAISNIFATIKKFISEFFEKLKSKNLKNTKFIQRNKAFIEKPFKIDKVSSKGDILAGMARVQKGLTIVPFNFESMKDDLKDKRAFFEKHILPTLKDPSNVSKRNVTWDANMSITDYCKAYYGASMGSEKFKPCEFSKAELETNKQSIVAFLNKPNVLSSINADLAKIETESKKVANTTSTTKTTETDSKGAVEGESKTGEGASKETPKQESYYSELYNTFITEADIEMSAEAKKEEGGEKGEGAASGNNEQSAAIKNYVECYKDVLLSKLTAAEFIISECMQIMIAHAKSHMSAEQQKAENDTASKESQQV